jgi:hypothetical protein
MHIAVKSIRAKNWKVGVILEDCRQSSSTHGCQFEIVDYDAFGAVVRQMAKDEYLVPGEIFSQIR